MSHHDKYEKRCYKCILLILPILFNLRIISLGCSACNPSQEKSEMKPMTTYSEADLEAEVESLRKWGIPDGTFYSEDIQRQLAQVAEPPVTTSSMIGSSRHKEHICPMCGKQYNQGITFAMFQQHVLDHFVEEEESYSILNTSEVKT
jgi:hypothetical protein